MTRPVDVAKIRITTPGGSAGPFGLTGGDGALYAASPSHLAVTLVPTGGAAVPLVYGTAYNIGGSILTGTGTITGTAPFAAGVLTVRRVTPNIQQSAWADGDGNPSARFESAEDYDRMLDQEAKEAQARALTAPDYVTVSNMQIPAEWFLGGKVLAFDPVLHVPTVEDPMVDRAEAAAAAAEASAAEAVGAAQDAGSDLWPRSVSTRSGAPPVAPAVGQRHLIDSYNPSGAWAGKGNQVAQWDGSAWQYSGVPAEGQPLFLLGALMQYKRDPVRGLQWQESPLQKVSVCAGQRLAVFGDSIAAGNAASIPARRYSTRVATICDMPEDNYALGGTGVVDSIIKLFLNTPGSGVKGMVAAWEAGHNDGTQFTSGSTPLLVEHVVKAALASWFSGTAIACSDAGVTKTGVWTGGDGSLGDKASRALAGNVIFADVAAATLTFNFEGDSFVVHTWDDDGSLGASGQRQFSVSIDGGAFVQSYAGNGVCGGGADATTRSHTVMLFRGLGKGPHTAVLTSGNAGVATGGVHCFIDCFATLIEPARAQPFIIMLPPRPNNYALAGAGHGTEAIFDAIDQGIRNAVAKFENYPIAIVRSNDWLDPAALIGDHIHPNDTGHEQLARAVMTYLDPSDRTIDSTWVPVFVQFTFVGIVNIRASYQKNGRWVKCLVHFSPAVGATVAWNKGAGANFTLPPNLPIADYSPGEIRDITTNTRLCGGQVSDPSRFYPDANQGATGDGISIAFEYITS